MLRRRRLPPHQGCSVLLTGPFSAGMATTIGKQAAEPAAASHRLVASLPTPHLFTCNYAAAELSARPAGARPRVNTGEGDDDACGGGAPHRRDAGQPSPPKTLTATHGCSCTRGRCRLGWDGGSVSTQPRPPPPVLTEGVSSRFQQVHSPRGGQGDDGVAREPLPPSRRALPPCPPSREEERMAIFQEEMTVVEPVEL